MRVIEQEQEQGAAVVSGGKARGRKPIVKDAEQFTLVLPGDLVRRVRARADAEGNSVASVLRRVLIEALA